MAERSKEQEVLTIMRQILGAVVRETTPPAGMRHPLSSQTIEDIKNCFALIAAREKELCDAQGIAPAKPYYVDEAREDVKVVPISNIGKPKKPAD